MLSEFLLALSFLSRLVPGQEADEAEMAAAVKWYPLAGLCIGLVAALPFALGLALGKPLLQGVAFSVFYLWLTRALHWDGLADLFDALGSGKSGDEFYAVLKDSRCGVFGVAALCAAMLLFVVGATYSLEYGRWPVLVWAVLMGRAVISPLACLSKPAQQGGLGRMVYAGSDGLALAMSTALALAAGIVCAGFWATLLVFAVCGGIVWYLCRVGERCGGVSGDYFGAAVVLAELATLLICAWLY